jgi:hypothetical protein
VSWVFVVGMPGFEPGASCSQSWRRGASRGSWHPICTGLPGWRWQLSRLVSRRSEGGRLRGPRSLFVNDKFNLALRDCSLAERSGLHSMTNQ